MATRYNVSQRTAIQVDALFRPHSLNDAETECSAEAEAPAIVMRHLSSFLNVFLLPDTLATRPYLLSAAYFSPFPFPIFIVFLSRKLGGSWGAFVSSLHFCTAPIPGGATKGQDGTPKPPPHPTARPTGMMGMANGG